MMFTNLRSRLRAFTALFTGVLVLASSLTLLEASPASASYGPNTNVVGKYYGLVVGESFTIDLSCVADGGDVITGTTYLNGSLPPGLTWTNGVVSGTPTTAGAYTISQFDCYSSGGMTSGGPSYATTFTVYDAPSDNPALQVEVLNDVDCSVRVVSVLPKAPDLYNTYLTFADSMGSLSVLLKEIAPGAIFDETFAMKSAFAKIMSHPMMQSFNVAGEGWDDFCNSDITVSMSYKHQQGSALATTSATIHPTAISAVGNTGRLSIRPVYDNACTVKIFASVPKNVDGDQVVMTANDGTNSWTIYYKNVRPDHPVDTYFYFAEKAWMLGDGAIDHIDGTATSLNCSTTTFSATANVATVSYPLGLWETATGYSECPAGQYGQLTSYSRICLMAPPGTFVESANMVSQPEDCEPGTYSENSGSTACTNAVAGTYVPDFGMSFALDCAPGTFSDTAQATECTPAAIGKYVAGSGKSFASSCPAGYTTAATGATSANDCHLISEPVPCPIGSYSSTGYSPCTNAAAGSYVSVTGAKSATPCPKGTFSSDAGSDTCIPAPIGKYIAITGATSATDCAAGYSTTATGSTSANDCFEIAPAELCLPGTYSDTGKAPCLGAPAGSYVPVAGSTVALLCPKGTYTTWPGMWVCVNAPEGKYVDYAGATEPSSCPTGYATLSSGSSSRNDCKEISPAAKCEPGTFSTTGNAPCTNAPAGSFVPAAGATLALSCPKGYFSATAKSFACQPAPIGKYVSTSGATSATNCPAGFSTTATASASAKDCYELSPAVKCQPGTYSATGNAPCTDAPAGSFVASTGATSATACALGTYSKTKGATSCIEAAKGYYVGKTGSTKQTKCKKGYGTELTGSRSSFECHKQVFQTAKAIKVAKKLKVNKSITTVARADAGLPLDAVATGACTLVAKTVTVKVKGKKVKQPRWVIKAGATIGTCKVTYSNEGDYTYKPFTVTKTIKITK